MDHNETLTVRLHDLSQVSAEKAEELLKTVIKLGLEELMEKHQLLTKFDIEYRPEMIVVSRPVRDL